MIQLAPKWELQKGHLMIGHSKDDDMFRVEPLVSFASDASPHIDEADRELENDNHLLVSDDE